MRQEKRKKRSYSERGKKRRILKEPIAIEARGRSMSPALANSDEDEDLLSQFYGMCDLCMEPRKPGGPMLCGRAVTYVNADKQVRLRDLAELALNLYNDKKLKSFKLVKVCKANLVGDGFYGLTFRAQEDGSEECPAFRGVVHVVGGKKAKFCEIKDDDEITLLPRDDDYVNSERSCENEDHSPCIRACGSSGPSGVDSATGSAFVIPCLNNTSKNELGDISIPDSGGVKHGSTTGSDLGLMSTSVQEFLASKKEERPTGIEIYEVVSSMAGLTRTEVFKAVQKLINGDVEQFRLLKALPGKEKREWVYFLINS